jgi:hypothetical protein
VISLRDAGISLEHCLLLLEIKKDSFMRHNWSKWITHT